VTTPRAGALEALQATLLGGRFLDEALDAAEQGIAAARDRALARELAYGVCRFWTRLEAIRDALLARPLRGRDRDLGIVIGLGLYQILYSRVAPHAAVSETVALCEVLGKRWATGLVNAVLRRSLRECEHIVRAVDARAPVRLAHPPWLLGALRRGWPQDWERIARANNVRAPMTLRVNRARARRDEMLAALAAAGIEARATARSADGIVLAQPREVAALPGFDEGALSVQDEAAQLAAGLLDARPGERFLDACCAPGGKLAHVLERTPGLGAALGVERDPRRAGRTAAGLRRLGLEAALRTADVRDPGAWWDGRPFDCILLDAPCSASGVIRRHPDVKHHRSGADLEALPRLQGELLEALWPLLAAGGRLLYATCSVLPEENAAVVSRFARARPEAALAELDVPWGRPASPGRQVLPGEEGMDGFYYALLVKR